MTDDRDFEQYQQKVASFKEDTRYFVEEARQPGTPQGKITSFVRSMHRRLEDMEDIKDQFPPKEVKDHERYDEEFSKLSKEIEVFHAFIDAHSALNDYDLSGDEE